MLAAPIKKEQPTEEHHFPIDFQTDRTYLEPIAHIKEEQFKEDHHLPINFQTDRTCPGPSEQQKMSSCDDCGIMFDNTHDLQRHVKNWCPENRKREREDDDYDSDQPPTKKWVPYPEEEEEEKSTENREQEAFLSMMHSAKEDNEEEWYKKMEKYEKRGMSEKEAKVKANKKITQAMDRYRSIINFSFDGPDSLRLKSGYHTPRRRKRRRALKIENRRLFLA